MTDNWTPDNLPILLWNRSLLSSTRNKPIQVGKARLTAQDKDAILALDIDFEREVQRHQEAEQRGFQIPDHDSMTADAERMQSRYQVEADWIEEITELPYQVTYYFPSSTHKNRAANGSYGKPGLTNRVLYEALCDGWNGGRRFIEDYFFSVFERRMRSQYEQAVQDLKQAIADEAQSRRREHRAYLSNYAAWATPMTSRTFTQLARATKKDIIRSLRTGLIPLQKTQLSDKTLAIRQRLGIAETAVFYATGNLIDSIIISVILLDKATGKETAVEVA